MIENPSQPSGFDSGVLHDDPGAGASADGLTTAGSMLRQARESVGLHIAALAVALKVPVKKLEALEMDRHDLLPDMVFVRALASSVCRTLKIDAVPVLALLPQSGRATFNQAPTPVQPSFNAYQATVKSAGRSSSISLPAAIAGLLLVMGAVLVVFWPTIEQTWSTSTWLGQAKDTAAQWAGKFNRQSTTAGTSTEASAEVPVPGVTEVTGPRTAPFSAADTPLASASMLGEAAPGMASAPNAAASGPAAARGSLGRASSGQDGDPGKAATADAAVTFIASGQASWVKVTDAKGAVVLSRTISAGEQVGASGALPLSVVVGRADATRVQVRGVAFDLTAYSRENVARFEVR